MKNSSAVLFFSLILCSSAFSQDRGIIQCEPGSTTPVPAWASPGGAAVVDQLSCGQMVSIIALERGYIKIELGERIGYVNAKWVRLFQVQSPQNPQINKEEVQTKQSDQANVNIPARAYSEVEPLPPARGNKPLRRNAKIYVEEMEGDLDGFIRAEMIKRKVPLEILLTPERAHYILTGSLVIQEKRAWHEGWLSSEKDHNVANIMVVDPRANKMLWASEAGDRSWFWGSLKRGGQRKTAERLVNNLKEAID